MEMYSSCLHDAGYMKCHGSLHNINQGCRDESTQKLSNHFKCVLGFVSFAVSNASTQLKQLVFAVCLTSAKFVNCQLLRPCLLAATAT